MPGVGQWWDVGRWKAPLLVVLAACNVAALAVGAQGQTPAPHLWVLLSLCGLACIVALALAARRQASAQGQIQALQEAAKHPPPELEMLRAQWRACEARLHEVMEAMPAGVAVYDNQDRLVAVNQVLANQHPYRGDTPLIGQTYEALLRRALRAGAYPEAVGQEEEWLALRLSHRGTQTGSTLRHTGEGPWGHLFEHHTPAGYLVMTRLDIAPLVEKSLALARADEQRQRLSLVDGLTGIANRRQFDESLRGEWQRCARNQSWLSLLVIDIDHFKLYNDRYGYLAGDECLRQVARILGLCVKRSGELVARFGSEEFAALLPGTDADEARRVAQRCMLEVQNARIPHAASSMEPWLSVSIGVASLVAVPGQLPAQLVEQAEAALLRAKTAGRARAEVFA